MRIRRLLTIPAAGLAAAALAAPAQADTLFTGRSQQDRPVTVRTGADGVVNLFRVTWRTRRCRGGEYLQDRTDFRPPFDSATGDVFGDRGSYTLRQRGGIRIRVTIDVSGRRIADPANPAVSSWQGTVKSTGVVRRSGRVIDRCTLRSIGWTATQR
jgi:hypothetical protein